MLGVGVHEVDRPAGADVDQVIKRPLPLVAARGRATAAWALAAAEVATPVLNMSGRQVLDASDSFGSDRRHDA